jgi:hypothetical protein
MPRTNVLVLVCRVPPVRQFNSRLQFAFEGVQKVADSGLRRLLASAAICGLKVDLTMFVPHCQRR